MKYQINLLSHKKEKSLDRVIYFALNYLRYILVITQIVVIAVFLMKLSIDQQIVDLQEAVDQKREIVAVSQPLLKEAQKADFETNQITAILDNQSHLNEGIGYALAQFPRTMYMKHFIVDGNTIQIDSIILDVQTVKAFISRLQKEKKFNSAQIKTIKKTDEGLEAIIELAGFGVAPPVVN